MFAKSRLSQSLLPPSLRLSTFYRYATFKPLNDEANFVNAIFINSYKVLYKKFLFQNELTLIC